MILLRVKTGVQTHFHIRATEWLMLWPSFFMGVVLLQQPAMFAVSPSYTQLGSWFGQPTWAAMVLCYSFVRLVALTVNGTFEGFPYSPHMRAGASIVGLFFWAQFFLGFLISAIYYGGAASALPAYSAFILMEFLNLYRAGSDIGRGLKRNAYG